MNQNVYKLYPFRACPAVKNQPIFTASPVLRRRAKRGKSQSPEDAPQLPECPEECRNAGRASGARTRLKRSPLWNLEEPARAAAL